MFRFQTNTRNVCCCRHCWTWHTEWSWCKCICMYMYYA